MVKLSTATKALARFPVDLARARRGSPSAPSTYLLVRRSHVVTSGRSTSVLSALMRSLPGNSEFVESETLRQMQDNWAYQSQELRTNGTCQLPNMFTPDEIVQLVDFATNGPSTLTHSDGLTSTGTYVGRSSDVVSAHLDTSFLLTQPAIQALLAQGLAAQVATARTGMWVTVHPPVLYWSCCTSSTTNAATEQRLARRYHSDFDGLGGLRLHVYLTDVDRHSAPMDYVRTSHLPGVIPRSMRRDVTDDISTDEVHRLFPRALHHSFIGPAGTSFMTDSNGLHRGNSPVTADRLFLVMPIQAGSLAGTYNRIRRIPVLNNELAMALRCHRPDLRLFVAAPHGTSKFAVIAG